MSVTDGNLTTDGAAQTVRVIGTVTSSGTVTASQGTAAASAGAWPIKLVDNLGVNVANVLPSGAVKVQIDNSAATAVPVSSGSAASAATLTAQSATGAGTTVDFGSGKQQITLAITASAGVSAGAVALEVSQDNVNFFRGTPATQSAPGVTQTNQGGAWRYARGNVTTTITGGTVSATLMAA